MVESKYRPLGMHLAGLKADELRASFADLETILGFSLPDSAHRYAAWWANHGSASRPTPLGLSKAGEPRS